VRYGTDREAKFVSRRRIHEIPALAQVASAALDEPMNSRGQWKIIHVLVGLNRLQ
jgi:hypothetical protein